MQSMLKSMPAARRDDPSTTVKVPHSLRERISREAAATGQTAAGFLSQVIDRWEREQRLASVRLAYDSVDDEYAAEVRHWDSTSTDGLDG